MEIRRDFYLDPDPWTFEKEKLRPGRTGSRETSEDLRISGAKRFFLRRDQQCDEAVGIGLFPAPKDRI